MSGFSGGSFSFSRSGRRGGFLRHSHSHSSGHRGRYASGGHYRQVRRRGPLGCLGAFMVGTALLGSTVGGLLTLLS